MMWDTLKVDVGDLTEMLGTCWPKGKVRLGNRAKSTSGGWVQVIIE